MYNMKWNGSKPLVFITVFIDSLIAFSKNTQGRQEMQKLIGKMVGLLLLVLFLNIYGYAEALMRGREAHEKYLYPIVRVTFNNSGGSGTIVFSKESNGKFSTYVLTNHHVISEAIKIEEKWDSSLGKNIKIERRSIVYVEIFKYKNLGIPVGTMRIEADLVIYNSMADIALLKLNLTEQIHYIATLVEKDKTDNYNLFDETIAVGCSLGFPPIATPGIINRKNFQIESLPYHMSTSQIIYGNSGGAMFLAGSGQLIGIPSMVAVIGWGTPVTHMGLFIPINRIYKWLEEEDYDFIFDSIKTEEECLGLREEKIKKSKENISK